MAEALTALTKALDVPLSVQQVAQLLSEELATLPKLLVVQEIQEDEGGATLRFQQGGHGRLARHDANYAASLRHAQRGQERQHPVGVSFGEEHAIAELRRADNDVPAQLSDDETGGTRIFFQGHDGVFHLHADHPEAARLRALLDEAVRRQARVWFIVQKPELTVLDVQPAGWTLTPSLTSGKQPVTFEISFVVAPDRLLKTADEILHSGIRCANALRRDIRALAKAYIDEADELNRAVHEIQTDAARVQIASLSPSDMMETAKRLQTIQFPNKRMQEKVQAVAKSYVLIAEKNRQLFEEFKERYRDKLPANGASAPDASPQKKDWGPSGL